MLKNIVLCSFLMFGVGHIDANAQEKYIADLKPAFQMQKAGEMPLVILNNKKTDLATLVKYADLIDNARTFKGNEAVKLYGQEAKSGVIIANSKSNVRFVDFDYIYSGNNNLHNNKNARVCIDGNIVNKNTILLKADDYFYSEILTKTNEQGKEEQFINIITRK